MQLKKAYSLFKRFSAGRKNVPKGQIKHQQFEFSHINEVHKH